MKYLFFSMILLLYGYATTGQIVAPGFDEHLIADSLNPVSFTIDHHGRIWLIEKNGRVLIIDEQGHMNPDPFLEIEVDDFNERGLLGIALHPNFDSSPYVYLYYTVPTSNHNRVSRFRANGDLAVPNSEEVLIELDQLSGGIHNAGALVFDQAGYLFIATGEAGNSQNSQDTTNLLGKILRIDDEGNIPSDNPFYHVFTDKQRSIWCLGLRNPFNLAYDPLFDMLYASDVGAGDFEEINRIEKGANYGWPIIEGPIQDQMPPLNYLDPLYAYDHNSGCAIVGLNLYRPEHSDFPNTYEGVLFFGDYCDGYIKVLNPINGELIETFATQVDRPLHIEEDTETGKLYYLSRAGLGGGSPGDNTQTGEGTMWQVSYTGLNIPQVSRPPGDLTIPIGESALFTIRANGMPPLMYDWYVNDTLLENNNDTLIIEDIRLDHDLTSIYCRVSNLHGEDTSSEATLRVTTNTRPIATITTPLPDAKFRAGDTIHFSGFIQDAEDELIDSSQYFWNVELHHNLHTHPVLGPIHGVSSGDFVIPTNGETDTSIYFRLQLSGFDMEGLHGQTSTNILPSFSSISIDGLPGANVNIDGRIRALPHSFSSLIHLNRTVTIPPVQQLNDQMIYFKQWENGSTNHIRSFATPDTNFEMSAEFEIINLGFGSGLLGHYYNDIEMDFDETAAIVRIDSQINFNWGSFSPDTNLITKDFFTVRWKGYIKPLAAETYEFIIKSDDGTRLWINDDLVIDDWINHPPIEVIGTYTFDTTELIPIRLEYFERTGGSEIALKWRSSHSPLQIIPKSQLYPLTDRNIYGSLWVDEDKDNILDPSDSRLADINILLLSAHSHQIVAQTVTNDLGVFEFISVRPGEYYMVVLNHPNLDQVIPFFGIDQNGRTPIFDMDLYHDLITQFIYHQKFTNTTDHHDHNPKSIISIFPNPTQGIVHILNNSGKRLLNIEVINVLGQRLTIDFQQQADLVSFDLNNSPNGFYQVQVNLEGMYLTQPVLLQK